VNIDPAALEARSAHLRDALGAVVPGSEPTPALIAAVIALTRDALDELHVLSVGIDLVPALEAQGFDGASVVAEVADACRRGAGDGKIPAEAAARIRAASQVLNIAWIADALDSQASVICPRSGACPRTPRCSVPTH